MKQCSIALLKMEGHYVSDYVSENESQISSDESADEASDSDGEINDKKYQSNRYLSESELDEDR